MRADDGKRPLDDRGDLPRRPVPAQDGQVPVLSQPAAGSAVSQANPAMRLRCLLFFATVLSGPHLLSGAVIGTNPPTFPLTADRLAELPASRRPAWLAYLERSEKLRATDEAHFGAEMKLAGLTAPLVPAKGRGLPREKPAEFWSGTEAAQMADHLISFQTPAGGWSKNTDQTTAARRPGERFGNEAGYVGTIDNDATISQLRFLAKIIAAAPSGRSAAWRTSFNRGLEYLLTAQYPNGAWPQVFPLEGGYHDAITYNDGAMTNVLTLLRDIGAAQGELAGAFVPSALRVRATAAVERGLACLLESQIAIDGRRTVWGQQHDPLTLAPCSARNYEMPSQASGESAAIFTYLMAIPDPSPAVVAAVHAAAAWFARTPLHDVVFKPVPGGGGRQLIPTPGAGPLWARYYEIGTDRPLFGDRDRSSHDDVSEISAERRNGYSWFGDAPKRALDHYRKWAKAHPPAAPR
jgi:PelA/Pel-15E family pectate lyase